MLTEGQTSHHWRKWGEVVESNDWRMEHGRMLQSARREEHGGWHQKVWAFAMTLAAQKASAVNPDFLRKGAYWWCLGMPKSLTQFDNGDLDRVLIGFRLLAQPDDLQAIQDHLAYLKFDEAKAEIERCRQLKIPCAVVLPDDPGERRRHLWFIRQSPEAIINHFVRTRFQGKQPEELPLRDLRDFTRTLKNRRNYNERPVEGAVFQRRVCNGNGRRLGAKRTIKSEDDFRELLFTLDSAPEDGDVPF